MNKQQFNILHYLFGVVLITMICLFDTPSYAVSITGLQQHYTIRVPGWFSSDEIISPQQFVADRIKKFEGFKSKKYKCVVSGVKLQGYGKSIGNKRTPSSISEKQAETWLIADLVKCTNDLDAKLPWWRDLSSVRQSAMLDLTYNMGIDKLLKFKQFITYMKRGSYAKAAKSLMHTGKRKTKYATQVGIRAIEVSTAIKTDLWVALKK